MQCTTLNRKQFSFWQTTSFKVLGLNLWAIGPFLFFLFCGGWWWWFLPPSSFPILFSLFSFMGVLHLFMLFQSFSFPSFYPMSILPFIPSFPPFLIWSFKLLVKLGPLLLLVAKMRPNVLFPLPYVVPFFRNMACFVISRNCQVFFSSDSSCPSTSLFVPSPPPVIRAWVLEVNPLTMLSIWVFLGLICIHKSLSFCNKKCKLFFVYLWITLFETHSTLQPSIYFCFSFNDVLSSLFKMAQPSTKKLQPDFGDFC